MKRVSSGNFLKINTCKRMKQNP